MNTQLATLDWLVFYGLMLSMILAVWITKSQEKGTSADYLIMGRKLTLPMFVGTLVATFYGNIIGVSQLAFNHGIYAFFTQGLFWYVCHVLFALFIAKRVRRSKAMTVPQMVGEMYGPYAHKLSASFVLAKTIPIVYTISLGVFLKLILDVSSPLATFLGIAFVVAYCCLSGLRSIVVSDGIQFTLMFAGVIVVLIASVYEYGGFSYLQASLPSAYFEAKGNHENMSSLLIWILIALTKTSVSSLYYQRCFAAESDEVAVRGIYISIIFWFIFDACIILGGMYAKAAMPDANSLFAYLEYGLTIMPVGLKGLFIASIAATIMSSLDSVLFVGSSSLSHDLLPKKYSNKRWIKIGSTLLIGSIAYIIAINTNKTIEEIQVFINSYTICCLFVPIAWGYFLPGKNKDRDYIIATLVGVTSVTIWQKMGFTIDSFFVGLGVTIATLAILTFGKFK
jgi:SSS family solute:Na+ symporter